MNTVLEISNKIIQCSQNDKLEIIISLRAFLFDNPILYWIDFSNSSNYEETLLFVQSHEITKIKKLNEDNLKKIGIKPIDLFLLPKNKKNILINLIDEIFDDYQMIVIFDRIRLNPFYQDDLFNFMTNNSENFSKKIFNTYKTRNLDAKNFLSMADLEFKIYENCFTLSRKNKIIDYWINVWGRNLNYNDPSLIEHLIIK